MATPVVFNSVAYSVPSYNDTGYAQGAGNLSAYLVAIASGTLQPSGGTFTLTGDINFGSNFGLLAKYYTSVTANPATAGAVRLAKTDTISWRNNANSGNLPLGIDSSNNLTFNGSIVPSGSGFVSSITGTANQVIASSSTGAVTLSLPQSIATSSTPTFAGETLTGQLAINRNTASSSEVFNLNTQSGAGIAASGWVTGGGAGYLGVDAIGRVLLATTSSIGSSNFLSYDPSAGGVFRIDGGSNNILSATTNTLFGTTVPGTDNTYDLGGTSKTWRNVIAHTHTADTVIARTSSGLTLQPLVDGVGIHIANAAGAQYAYFDTTATPFFYSTYMGSNKIFYQDTPGVGFVDMKPASGTATYTLTLPPNAGSANQTWFSNGSGTMSFGTLPVGGGGTGATSQTAYAVLCGGTSSTGAFQSVAGLGSSGQVLTSNGAAALPTFQTLAGTGTVNSGTATHLTYYATSTNAVSDASGATISGAYTFSGGAGALTMSSSTIAMGSNKITGLANGTASTDAAAFGQIFTGFQAPVQATSVSSFTTTSSTFQNTNLAATITPTSSSHRIRISVCGDLRNFLPGTTNAVLTIKRGSTDISPSNIGFATVAGTAATTTLYDNLGVNYIDSPATTSSTTYTVAIKSTDNVNSARFGELCAQVITLEEIV